MTAEVSPPRDRHDSTRWCFRFMLIGFATFQAWSGRWAMNSDGIAYIDLADQYAHGLWKLSTYWSPAYPALLAVPLRLAGGAAPQFPLVHATNLLIFAAALGAWELFLNEVTRYLARSATVGWYVYAYSIAAWALLSLDNVWLVTPDLLVAATVLLVAALLLGQARHARGIGWACALGALLGAAVYVKAALFPVSIISAGAAAAVNHRRRLGQSTAMLGAFAALTVPLMAALVHGGARSPFGDAGPLNFLWSVQRAPFPYWSPSTPGFGTGPHSIMSVPGPLKTYTFAVPATGTFPVWDDPGYWYMGETAPFNTSDVLRESLADLVILFELLSVGMILGLLLLTTSKWSRVREAIHPLWTLFVLGTIGLAAYVPVLVEGRYIAPFALLIAVATTAMGMVTTEIPRALVERMLVAVAAVLLCVNIGKLRGLTGVERANFDRVRALGAGFRAAGLPLGARVAVVGSPFDAYWARIANAHIVAAISGSDLEFWAAWNADSAEVRKQARNAGADFLVVTSPPPDGKHSGWRCAPGVKGGFISTR